ncbi:hypothetical protein GCM10010420_49640 [Streptomyces glaucosporus]|uniref:Uncharacterized protein n=1 Tax=Streptomyces glaucosporus TaxID=284044 RepID=A0ABN3IW13_9ACTN
MAARTVDHMLHRTESDPLVPFCDNYGDDNHASVWEGRRTHEHGGIPLDGGAGAGARA